MPHCEWFCINFLLAPKASCYDQKIQESQHGWWLGGACTWTGSAKCWERFSTFLPKPVSYVNIAQINLPPITVKVETTFQPHYEDGNMMIDDWNYDSDWLLMMIRMTIHCKTWWSGFPRGRGGGIGFERQTSERGWWDCHHHHYHHGHHRHHFFHHCHLYHNPYHYWWMMIPRFDRNDRSAAREEEMNGGVSPRKGYTRWVQLFSWPFKPTSSYIDITRAPFDDWRRGGEGGGQAETGQQVSSERIIVWKKTG